VRLVFLTLTLILSLLFAAVAQAKRPVRTSQSVAVRAITYVFGPYASQALRVADCESHLSIWARNSNWPPGDKGDYLGLFQMGDFARARYGHDWNPWAQAISAWRYFDDSGRDWSPWTCKP
jgi:hypothetical protein